MTNPYLKSLALAASITLALTACGKHETPTATAAPASSATAASAASSATASAADATSSIFDVSELGPAIDACQDFNGFVNAKWVAANPIPSDRTRWGAFDQLAEASLKTQHEIVDAATKGSATAGIDRAEDWLPVPIGHERGGDRESRLQPDPTQA